MTSPQNSKAEDAEALLNARRAFTSTAKKNSRQMFVFNEDGTIAGLQTVEPPKSPAPSGRAASGGWAKDKKFGHLSSAMSVGAQSLAESKVAFSDANYLP